MVSDPMPPDPKRNIIVAIDDQLFEMSILDFVIYHSSLIAQKMADGGPVDIEEVTQLTGMVAEELCGMGWFTAQEYNEAWIAGEMEQVEDEIKRITE